MAFSLRKSLRARQPSVSTSMAATSRPPRSTTAVVVRVASQDLPDGPGPRRRGDRRRRRWPRRSRAFATASGLPRNVRLGVANQQIVVRVVELPRIEDEKQRDAAVRFQASEAIAMPLDEAVLDHQIAGYARRTDGTARMQVVLVAARRKMIETLLEAVKAAGLKADGIDLDAFALVRALAVDSHGGERPGARLLPPRRRDQPGHRRRLQLLLHPSAVGRLGRRGGRLAARRRDPPVDRLLHDPAPGPAGRRGRAVGPGLVDGSWSRPRVAPGHPRPGRRAARRASTPPVLAPARIRTATPWRPASPWERRHEARQPASAGTAPARAPRGRRQGRLRRRRRAGGCCWPWSSSTC